MPGLEEYGGALKRLLPRGVIPGFEDGRKFRRRTKRKTKHATELEKRAHDLLVVNHRDKRKRWQSDAALAKESDSVVDFITSKEPRRRGRKTGRVPKRRRLEEKREEEKKEEEKTEPSQKREDDEEIVEPEMVGPVQEVAAPTEPEMSGPVRDVQAFKEPEMVGMATPVLAIEEAPPILTTIPSYGVEEPEPGQFPSRAKRVMQGPPVYADPIFEMEEPEMTGQVREVTGAMEVEEPEMRGQVRDVTARKRKRGMDIGTASPKGKKRKELTIEERNLINAQIAAHKLRNLRKKVDVVAQKRDIDKSLKREEKRREWVTMRTGRTDFEPEIEIVKASKKYKPRKGFGVTRQTEAELAWGIQNRKYQKQKDQLAAQAAARKRGDITAPTGFTAKRKAVVERKREGQTATTQTGKTGKTDVIMRDKPESLSKRDYKTGLESLMARMGELGISEEPFTRVGKKKPPKGPGDTGQFVLKKKRKRGPRRLPSLATLPPLPAARASAARVPVARPAARASARVPAARPSVARPPARGVPGPAGPAGPPGPAGPAGKAGVSAKVQTEKVGEGRSTLGADMKVAPTQQVTVAGGGQAAGIGALVAKIDQLLKEQKEAKRKTASKKAFGAAKKQYKAYRKKMLASVKAQNKQIKKKELARIRRLPTSERAKARGILKARLSQREKAIKEKLPSKISDPGQLRRTVAQSRTLKV